MNTKDSKEYKDKEPSLTSVEERILASTSANHIGAMKKKNINPKQLPDLERPLNFDPTEKGHAANKLVKKYLKIHTKEPLKAVKQESTYFPIIENTPSDSNRIGQTTLKFYDSIRNRPVVTELWYPTSDSLKESDKYFSPFLRSYTARDAKLPTEKHPLILISHGNGGSRFSLEWLAQSLVLKGYIVAAVDHWGNTTNNKIAVEFIKPWERPQDISVALTELLEHEMFKKIINANKIGALGYSYGGYTVLALAGAILDYSELLEYYETTNGKTELNEIREFPGISKLLQDESFIKMTKHVPPLKDFRIKAFFAISPGTAQGFVNTDQFKAVKDPVFIVGCESDEVTPVNRYARHYHNLIKGSKYFEFPGRVGHYVMLAQATDEVKKEAPIFFVDHSSVDRHQVHQKVMKLSMAFFNKSL